MVQAQTEMNCRRNKHEGPEVDGRSSAPGYKFDVKTCRKIFDYYDRVCNIQRTIDLLAPFVCLHKLLIESFCRRGLGFWSSLNWGSLQRYKLWFFCKPQYARTINTHWPASWLNIVWTSKAVGLILFRRRSCGILSIRNARNSMHTAKRFAKLLTRGDPAFFSFHHNIWNKYWQPLLGHAWRNVLRSLVLFHVFLWYLILQAFAQELLRLTKENESSMLSFDEFTPR